MARMKTSAKRPAEPYPHVTRWCNKYGWIEVGYECRDKLFAKAIHEGGLVWGGQGPYSTIDDAMRALEEGIKEHMEKNGWE
jgi:hypothetical protein